MRRIYGILIFSMLGILQLSVPVLAQSPKGLFSEQETDGSLVRFPPMELVGIEAEPGVQFMPERLGETQGNLIRLSKAEEADDSQEDLLEESVSDPLEPINRVFFQFNDKLYFWLLKPLATGYKAVTPQSVRVGVRNFFYNVAFPIRFFNCLFQAKFEGAGFEFTRFILNTTVGVAGFLDVATDLDIERYEEDLGQTLGSYGWGSSFYINWPVLGPSSPRDTLGLIGDAFLDPVNYAVPRTKYNASVKAYDGVNETSLSIGDYEDLKRAALDPYIAVRDAYYQNRRSKIEE